MEFIWLLQCTGQRDRGISDQYCIYIVGLPVYYGVMYTVFVRQRIIPLEGKEFFMSSNY